MSRRFPRRVGKAGLPPGTLMYTGDKVEVPAQVSLIEYDEQTYEEKDITAFQQCVPYRDRPSVTWINVTGFSQVANLAKLGECFNLHPLVMEDIVSTDQRPKIEDYDDYLFVVLKTIATDPQTNEIGVEQVSLILGPNYVLSFQESDGKLFAPINDRLKAAKGRIRKAGADYLAYSIIDLIVDNYFVVLEQFSENIESLEDEVVRRPTANTLQAVHRCKNDMIILRKSLWPLREVVGRLERRESPLINEGTAIYFKDVYDHVIIAVDSVETYRDILSGMLDIYLSSVSNRLNEVMKVLTVIATIFMPLTFLAGVYGMNFKNLPELEWHYGYYAWWGFVVLVAGSMFILFWRKKWF